jgi:hypothetical protein
VTINLGSIEHHDPREVWKNEAHDFTPWLRDNIGVLGQALGLEIDPEVESEVTVGAFSADLLATHLGTGALVLIENQLEATDHSHLGQMLTYASGLDTKVLVWVARSLRDEHRQALTWLNENTLEDVRFFGVEIELLSISDSPMAPNFKVVVTPSEWQKSGAAAVTGGGYTERQRLYREFWGSVIAAIRQRDPNFTTADPEKPSKQHWCSFSAGRPGFQDHLVFGWEDGEQVMRAQLYIDTPDKAQNKRAYDALLAEKTAIEAEFGEPLIWTRRDDIRASQIYTKRPGSVRDDPEALAGHREWLVDRAFRIREVFGPRIKGLDLGSSESEEQFQSGALEAGP